MQSTQAKRASIVALVALPAETVTLLRNLLEREGVRVLTVENASEVEELLRTSGGPAAIDAAVVGYDAAHACADALRALDPLLPIVVLVADLDDSLRRELRRNLRPYAIADQTDEPSRWLELVEGAVAVARATRRALEAHELRSVLAGRLSEELYGLLQVIRGYAEVLSDATPPAANVIERLQTAAEASLALAQSYVDLRRLDRSSVAPRRENVDVVLLLEELSILAKRRMGARPLSLRATCSLAEATLSSDSEKLHALLAHLLLHVIESTRLGEVHLDVAPDPAGGTRFLVGPRRRGRVEADAGAESSIAVAIAERLGRLIDAKLSVDAGGRNFVVNLAAPLRGKLELETRSLH